MLLQPAYVDLVSGQLHLRWAGTGPALTLLHDAPGSSAEWDTAFVERLAEHRTVIAPDLIGFGGSTVPDEGAGDVDLQATAVAETLGRLGVLRTGLAAAGAGAAVAVRLAERYPDLVSGILVLEPPYDGVDEAPPSPDPDQWGSHLVRLFGEIRQSRIFRPWWQPGRDNRVERGVPSPGLLHSVFVDTADHGRAHRDLAAAAAVVWRGVDGSALAVGSKDPVLSALALGDDEEAAVIDVPSGGPRGYVRSTSGHLHVRAFGDWGSGERPILMLHANPGSGASLEPLARELARTRPCLVWDTPGHGRSTPLASIDGEWPSLDGTYVPLLVELLDAFGIDICDVYGTHTGAGLAVELALTAPDRVGALLLDGVPLFDDQPELVASVLANYFVDLTPDTHGSHLLRAWGATSDMALWWPWFNHTPGGIRPVDAYSPALLHRVTLDMLRSAPHYHHSYSAAFRWPATSRLPLVQQRVLVGASPSDPLASMTPIAVDLLRDGTAAELDPLGADGSAGTNAAILLRFLAKGR